MRAVLPGKPKASLQAVCTAQWSGKRLIVYISGNALVILGGPHQLLQTIYHDDTQLLASVAIDKETGKIATCAGENILIYRPYGQNEDVLKWSLQFTSPIDLEDGTVSALSWGTSEELLVGSSALCLYQTNEEGTLIWRRKLSSPVASALFSPDSTLIASTAKYDRLVKLWRRLSYGSDDVRFDFSYLSHPSTVTSLQWRASSPNNQSSDDVLYTVCADNKVRVWALKDPHASQVLQLWAEIDIQASIQPRNLDSRSQNSARYVFFIDGKDFSSALEAGSRAAINAGKQNHALEHLNEIAERNPEICVVLDDYGHMSAWGLENIGSRARAPSDVFNFAHVENFNMLLTQTTVLRNECVRFFGFCTESPEMKYAVLVHHFDGRIVWLEGRIDEFFHPFPGKARLHLKSLWTGHEGSVKKIVRTASGTALISRTNDNEGIIWKQTPGKDGMALSRSSFVDSPEHIHRTWLLSNGDFAVNLHHHSISLWDTRGFEAKQIAWCGFKLEGKPLCLLELPRPDPAVPKRYLATMTSFLKGIVWEIRLPREGSMQTPEALASDSSLIKEYSSFDLNAAKEVTFVIPVDPAGSAPILAGFLDTFAQDLALSYTQGGVLQTWTAKVEAEGSVDWLMTSNIETGIDRPYLTSGSSTRKIALVNSLRNGLTIWDSRSGQLEFEKGYSSQEVIQDLDWTSTPDLQSILAVGFQHKVLVLAQIRYDYLDKGPAWAPIREIYIRESTPHAIGDSTWLGSGNLVIGAGTQLFVYDKLITSSDEMITDLSIPAHGHASVDIFDVVRLLNGPLPVYHPQFLAQCILSGKMLQVSKIVISLNKTLKFFDGDNLDSLLSIPAVEFFTRDEDIPPAHRKQKHSAYADFSDEEEPDSVTEELAATLNENLARYPVPYLSSQEQMHLADLVECVATAEKHRRSMDTNAMRYLLFVRQHLIRKAQGRRKEVNITWREIAWAFHSGSQDILVDLTSRHYQGRMLWEHAKESGMFMWMTDIDALRAQFETIARNEYTKTDEKNPIDCSLYYIALKKKTVLLGLWRMAAWNREQSSTQKFLSNNFQEHRWKTAALKNAYALLGKRRFEYAAAFFLLAGNLRDAVNICAQQMQDLQLAIAIARVYEGDKGLVLREILEDRVLPLAAFEGNRWLAMWAFWMLGRRDMAVRSLITPVYTLLDTPENPSQEARSYLATDPALVVLYKQLRDNSLQTLKGASEISPRAEWEFVMQTARLYDRMGCDLLALDLVRNWDFLQQPKDTLKPMAEIPDPRKMLRRRSSLVVDDLPSPRLHADKNSVAGKPPPTSAFQEPDASSLLDSFGF
ncbi:regulator of (H+)-ATPase in vacuolar membrane [Lambiella insularis]|nr:regulator of (H+)-ATPase in vacuolar membrane [Lambiella insularis]